MPLARMRMRPHPYALAHPPTNPLSLYVRMHVSMQAWMDAWVDEWRCFCM